MDCSLAMTEPSVDQQTRDILRAQGLPEGLLPAGIVDGEIAEDGGFRLVLAREEQRVHGGHRVRYSKTIRGVVVPGEVRELGGVAVKNLVWLPVQRIRATAGGLTFHVGPVQKELPVSEFPLR